MKAAPFEYVRAGSIDEACELLQQSGDDAKLIAGGQSLVPMMAMRLTRPRRLVDINEIPALRFVTSEPGVVRIGACTTQRTIERDPALVARVPMLGHALKWVGHVQTRNRGTVGGSLVHADPAAELPLAAQVLGAQMVLRSATGTRSVAAADFFNGPLTTATGPHECLEEIHWPVWSSLRVGSAFIEVSRRHGDFAIIAAAAQVEIDTDGKCVRAAFGLGGGGFMPLAFPHFAERLIGTRLEDAVLKSAVHDAAVELDPGSDLHASADYRRHLAAVLALRSLRAAYDRAAIK